MSKENEKMFDDAQVAELEREEEPTYRPDYASDKIIQEALEHAGFAEAMGYDEETASELHQMGGFSSYGASDLEEKLPDDSPAKAMLAEGYHSVLFENADGQNMLDYSIIQAAANDIAQAVGNMDHIDNDTRDEAHTRYAEALTRREVTALENALANWSSADGNAEEISQITGRFDQITSDHRETLTSVMNEIAATRETIKQLDNYSGATEESAAAHLKEAQLTEFLATTQTHWYLSTTNALLYIDYKNDPDIPEAFRKELSNINYDLNRIIPEHMAAAYALEDAGLMDAVDYLSQNSYHELGSAILDGRISIDDALEIAIQIDDIPKAMAYAQYGGDTSELQGAKDPEPTYAKYYDEIKNEARQILVEAFATADVRAIAESIQVIRDISAETRIKAYNESLTMPR